MEGVFILLTAFCQQNSTLRQEVLHVTYSHNVTTGGGKEVKSVMEVWLTDKPDFFIELKTAGTIIAHWYDGKHLHTAFRSSTGETRVSGKLSRSTIQSNEEAAFVALFVSMGVPLVLDDTANEGIYCHHLALLKKLGSKKLDGKFTLGGAEFTVSRSDGLIRHIRAKLPDEKRLDCYFFTKNDVTGYNREIIKRWAKGYFYPGIDESDARHIGEGKEDILGSMHKNLFAK
jgi:hypothetical protein